MAKRKYSRVVISNKKVEEIFLHVSDIYEQATGECLRDDKGYISLKNIHIYSDLLKYLDSTFKKNCKVELCFEIKQQKLLSSVEKS